MAEGHTSFTRLLSFRARAASRQMRAIGATYSGMNGGHARAFSTIAFHDDDEDCQQKRVTSGRSRRLMALISFLIVLILTFPLRPYSVPADANHCRFSFYRFYDDFRAIYDAFPASGRHFLVMPCYHFPPCRYIDYNNIAFDYFRLMLAKIHG